MPIVTTIAMQNSTSKTKGNVIMLLSFICAALTAKQYIVEVDGRFKLPSSVRAIYKFKVSSAMVISSTASLETLSNLKGVKNIWEDLFIAAPKPDISTAISNITVNNAIHELTGVKQLHENGYFGDGVKVGVIDTGLDYNHPAFGSCFKTPGCKVIAGYDFQGDDGTNEDEDPIDNCQMHGTHVSGIVAGDDTLFTGVAPNAKIGIYKIFPCVDSARMSIIMRALELAYHDGMDIVNLSVGGFSGWDNTPYCNLIDKLSELGMTIVICQGNDGAEGLFTGWSPSIAKNAIAVASFNNRIYINFQILKSNDLLIKGEVVKEGTGSYPIVLSSSVDVSNDGCTPHSINYKGSAVLIKRGACALADKIKNAIDANAALVLLYNNVDGLFNNGYHDDSLTTGVYLLSGKDGKLLMSNPGAVITINSDISSEESASSGYPSDFSSYGPGSALQIKPEASAIGGSVFSSLPLNQGKYGLMSGTSMATPYISGIIALYIGKHGKTAPIRIKQLLMNNGVISDRNGVYSVTKQGPGLINVTRMLFNPILATPFKLELGDEKWNSYLYTTKKITVTNDYHKTITFKITHVPATSVSSLEFGKIRESPISAKVTFSSYIVVKTMKSAVFSVDIRPPNLPIKEQWIYSGFIKITPQGTLNAFPINVPYMGYKGALKDASILGNDGIFPNLITVGHLDAPFSGYHNASDVISADFTKNGTIVFQMRIQQATLLLTIELYDAITKKKLGFVNQQQSVGRTFSVYNADTPEKYILRVPWVFGECVACYTASLEAGKVKFVAVEDGEYFVRIIVEKPFRDGVETFTSPRIYINRQE